MEDCKYKLRIHRCSNKMAPEPVIKKFKRIFSLLNSVNENE